MGFIMALRGKWILVALLAFLLLSASLAVVITRPVSAQDAAEVRLSGLIRRMTAAGEPVIIEFAVPVVAAERVWTIPDAAKKRAISIIGDDFICFSEPWNTGTRERCTPIANIVSVSFER